MMHQAISPPEIAPSLYAREILPRAALSPRFVSLNVRELFADIPEGIYSPGGDLSRVRKATEDALANVDMGMIRPGDKVNVLCCEHSFIIQGGEPYAEIIRATKDVVKERTGCEDIRLRIGAGVGFHEAEELVEHYGFDEHFDGKTAGIVPLDKGIPIETEIGTLYGVAKAYDADKIIHVHYDDPREIYLHRFIDRALKPFGMGYARLETRSVFHSNFGNRSGNFIPRAIFNSPFVQEKYAFSCIQMSSPAGITGVEADNDTRQLNRRLIVSALRAYGKMYRLICEIDECVAVLDGGKWPWYIHGGGITSGNLFMAPLDFLDLRLGSPQNEIGSNFNPAIKAFVVNNTWKQAFWDLELRVPTIMVAAGAPELPFFGVEQFVTAADIETAMDFAVRIAETDKIILFDGSFGHITLSPSLAEYMLKKAPEVARQVDEELLPMWLRQRGIDPEEISDST
jgi:hypothetical protein